LVSENHIVEGIMKIGILGTGDVGRALGRGFLDQGHEVCMGARDAANPKLREWVAGAGPKALGGTFADAAGFGDIVVLATLGTATEDAIRAAGIGRFEGKVVIDTTNPLDFGAGFPPTLAYGGNDSGGERIQRLLPSAKVVKAFNTVGNAHMYKPEFPGGRPDMFIAGDDEAAKATVAGILDRFGWGVADVGGIAGSRALEAMCIAWVLYGAKTNTWDHAFKLLRK
jgi:predicted dinucleotide-binding enzyme